MNLYIKILRLDHIPKHVFILPGIFLAYLYYPEKNIELNNTILGFLCAIISASSNYVINEYLDKNFDKYHPLKNKRVLVEKKLSLKNIIFYYIFLVALSLIISLQINFYFFITNLIFIISGIIYNVKPFRLKDKVYFDVLTESLNNPIRLFLGWFIISDNISILPPVSFLLFYWFSGAFLMSSKRLSEIIFFKRFSKIKNLIKYRPSYKYYNQNKLTLVCIVYLMLISFNSAIFLLKYREELILLYPIIILLFSTYFYFSIKLPDKAVFPEKVYLNKYIVLLTFLTFFLFFLLFYFDLPLIENLIQKTIFK